MCVCLCVHGCNVDSSHFGQLNLSITDYRINTHKRWKTDKARVVCCSDLGYRTEISILFPVLVAFKN